ncbi:hypothetical protein [Ensifer sesbaniae]|uniref:hypothetical protein n=1 Tax=Ensifer sesbaniae TaxID=1214071 RepID=UPI0015680F68|nr:hypothetical protein [Ensifer sesbaniae]NRQ16757.1 hypothetical protein [Ensifer sesbaniae]
MARTIKAEKAQKINLMLSQAVTAMRVNERLLCELLRWTADHSDDPKRFIQDVLEKAGNDLTRAGRDDSMTSLIATHEALEYLHHLAAEIHETGTNGPAAENVGEVQAPSPSYPRSASMT